MVRRTWAAGAMMCVMLMLAATAMAQPAGGNGGNGNGGFGGGGGRRGRGGGDPAAFQAQQMDQIRQDLGASDDEWKVLQPKVQAVMTARTEVQQGQGRGGGGRRGGGGGGNFGGGGQNATTEVGRAMQELRDILNNNAATADQILAKLTNLRNARTRAEANLTAARKDLKDLLTARQEAILVTLGYMD